MANNQYNPIRAVDGVAVPCPSSYEWKLEDVSKGDASRTEDGTMHKLRFGQVIGINIVWKLPTFAEAALILRVFNPEYITIEYLDGMTGNWSSKVFYVGNRSAPLYNSRLGRWESISFNLIAREV